LREHVKWSKIIMQWRPRRTKRSRSMLRYGETTGKVLDDPSTKQVHIEGNGRGLFPGVD